jgi:hypothetical protein
MLVKNSTTLKPTEFFTALTTFPLAPVRNCGILSGAENDPAMKMYGWEFCMIREFR